MNIEEQISEAQSEYMQDFREREGNVHGSRFHEFSGIFDYMQEGDTVALIGCGNIVADMYHAMEQVGEAGDIVLIDGRKQFIYERADEIFDLERPEEVYVELEEGREGLRRAFQQAGIYPYVQELPPYPDELEEEGLLPMDHVVAINAAAELQGSMGDEFDDFICETHEKMSDGGSLMVQGLQSMDIMRFNPAVHEVVEEYDLDFEEDPGPLEQGPEQEDDELLTPADLGGIGGTVEGEWVRWVKEV